MLQSSRTLIRPVEYRDAQSLFAYKSNPEVNKYQGWLPQSIREVEEFIARNPSQFNMPETWFQLVVEDRESQIILGDVGIHFVDKAGRICEFGITFHPEHQGKGLALEVMQVIMDHLYLDLEKHRVFASVDPRNTASVRLMERLGFRKEAHFKESLFLKGEWVDDVIFGILRKEWIDKVSNPK